MSASQRFWRYFDEGGPRNMAACLAFLAAELGVRDARPRRLTRVSAFGRFEDGLFRGRGRARRMRSSSSTARSISPTTSRRSRRWRGRSDASGFATTGVYRHQPQGRGRARPLARADRARELRRRAQRHRLFRPPRRGGGNRSRRHRRAGACRSCWRASELEAWRASPRGPRARRPRDACRAAGDRRADSDPRDLLQERGARDASTEFGAVAHPPLADRVAFVADLAASWARLRRTPPARQAPRLRPLRLSRERRAHRLCRRPRHARERRRDRRGLARRRLRRRAPTATRRALIATFRKDRCRRRCRSPITKPLRRVAEAFRTSRRAAWGEPADRPRLIDGAFRFRFVRARQADRRGAARSRRPAARKGEYHDLTLAPRHSYVAFHFWLTRKERVDALIQLGAHGTLEWLPGKAVALSEACAPEVLARPDAGDLSLHRQQSRRGGAGQTPDRRGDDRPSDAAARRRGLAWRGARARSAVR